MPRIQEPEPINDVIEPPLESPREETVGALRELLNACTRWPHIAEGSMEMQDAIMRARRALKSHSANTSSERWQDSL